MRQLIIDFLKRHLVVQSVFFASFRALLNFIGLFVKRNKKQILFASYGGRGFDDSPKEIYKEICKRPEFRDYDLVWAFIDTNNYHLKHARVVKIDSKEYYKTLLTANIWVSNSGADRGIGLSTKNRIVVETWHGTPLKKICGEENNSTTIENVDLKRKIDKTTIRCAQSEYDLEILSRVFNADKSSFLLCDLPRNDTLVRMHNKKELDDIRNTIGVPSDKKVLLYMPTYREYEVDENNHTFMRIPMMIDKWQSALGNDYILLVRAHYSVYKSLDVGDSGFTIDVSKYPNVEDLYLIADAMITDYSSSFIDYSILCRPMFCFAYDLDEYCKKRGLYIDLEKELPCRVNRTEDELLEDIKNCDYSLASDKTRLFHEKYTPHAGNSTKTVVDAMVNQINDRD